jgi:hypothetical protein
VSLERSAEVGAAELIAVWAFEGVDDQLLRLQRVGDAGVELGDLALGELTPGAASLGRGREQPSVLGEREARVPLEPDQRDLLGARPLVDLRSNPEHNSFV